MYFYGPKQENRFPGTPPNNFMKISHNSGNFDFMLSLVLKKNKQ